jgi:hypothetical protein
MGSKSKLLVLVLAMAVWCTLSGCVAKRTSCETTEYQRMLMKLSRPHCPGPFWAETINKTCNGTRSESHRAQRFELIRKYQPQITHKLPEWCQEDGSPKAEQEVAPAPTPMDPTTIKAEPGVKYVTVVEKVPTYPPMDEWGRTEYTEKGKHWKCSCQEVR